MRKKKCVCVGELISQACNTHPHIKKNKKKKILGCIKSIFVCLNFLEFIGNITGAPEYLCIFYNTSDILMIFALLAVFECQFHLVRY